MPPTATKEMTVETLLEQPHFSVLRKGKVSEVQILVEQEEQNVAKPVRRTKSETIEPESKKPLIDLTTHKGKSNFNIMSENRCGFDVLTGFDYSVKVGGRGLNKKHFVIDAPAISNIMDRWKEKDSWWAGSCEDVAASIAQGVLALAEENIDMILVTVTPNDQTEIELMWQRGQQMPTNGVKRMDMRNFDYSRIPEEYFRGCGWAKRPY